MEVALRTESVKLAIPYYLICTVLGARGGGQYNNPPSTVSNFSGAPWPRSQFLTFETPPRTTVLMF